MTAHPSLLPLLDHRARSLAASVDRAVIHRGDFVAWQRGREWLAQNGHIPRAHAVLCDPPYGLAFMNSQWDDMGPHEYQAWCTEWGRLLLSFVYPGAVLMAFGGTRTYHRLAAGLEDAGWIVADCLMWVTAQGFPKSHNVGCKCNDRKDSSRGRTVRQHNLRQMRETYLSSPQRSKKEQREILQPFMREQKSNSTQRTTGSQSQSTNGKQPSLERRQLYRTRQGLQNDKNARSSKSTKKRVRVRAYRGNGKRTRQTIKTWRRSAPHRREQVKQSSIKSETIRHPSRSLGKRTSDGRSHGAGRCPKCGGLIDFKGYGSALSPAYEPIVLARAPWSGTYAQIAQTHGTGAINVDGGRIDTEPNGRALREVRGDSLPSSITGHLYGKRAEGSKAIGTTTLGRWPKNLLLSCACTGDDHTHACPVSIIGEQSGESKDTAHKRNGRDLGMFPAPRKEDLERGHNDSGTAARMFYCAKSARWEREAGLHDYAQTTVGDGRKKSIDNPYQRGETKRRNRHPTVKPIQLTEYLARLLLPPTLPEPRRLLVPFCGSGSEMIGAVLAGWDAVIGFEQSDAYADIAEARLKWWGQFKDYDMAKRAWDADQAEAAVREAERAAGVEQLALWEVA